MRNIDGAQQSNVAQLERCHFVICTIA